MEWLQNMNIIQNNFTLLNTTALGLKPDTSKYALQINYCLLLARYHIWLGNGNGNAAMPQVKCVTKFYSRIKLSILKNSTLIKCLFLF